MRRLLDRAVAASSNGIVITDPRMPDDPIVYVNPAFERISGYPMDEVLGHNCRFLQGEDRDQPALDELRSALGEERESRVVLKNYRKDGTPFWNELYVSPIHDEEGDLTQVRRLLADELRTYTMEKRYLKSDGSIVWVNLTVSLVRDAAGEPAYFIAAGGDISGRKKAEEESDLPLVKEQ